VIPPPYIDLDPALLRDGTEFTRLLLVRHAQQESTPAGVMPQAWLDGELTGTGRRQAAVVAEHLAVESLAAVACSHMLRARATAEVIAAGHRVEPLVRPDLAEVDAYADMPADVWPPDHVGAEVWAAAHVEFARTRRWDVYTFGETGKELRARATAAIEDVIDRHAGQAIAVVCHGGVINAYLAQLLGIGADMFFLPAHASVSVVRASLDGRRVVESLNDRHHLEALDLLTY
jgi:broad specificity phosphatase PhoE